MAFETFEDVTEQIPHFIDKVYNKRRLQISSPNALACGRPIVAPSKTSIVFCLI